MTTRKDKPNKPDELDEWAAKSQLHGQIASRDAKLSDLKKLLKAQQQETELLGRHLETLTALRSIGNVTRIAPSKRSGKNEACAVVVLSDLHVEEHVDPKTLNERNEFNLEIAADRGEKVFRNALRLIDIQRTGARIDKAVLALLGDNISGYIHDELVEGNFLAPPKACEFATQLLIRGIDYWLERSDLAEIRVPCVVGNHGRITQKKRYGTRVANNIEYLIYSALATRYEKEPRVKIQIADGLQAYVDVLGVMIRFTHGDDIGYEGGIGGLSIPLRKACDAWDQFIPAKLTVIGHWHQFIDYGFALINGSLIGFNAYALGKKCRYEQPQQAFFLVDAERRQKTIVAPIFVR